MTMRKLETSEAVVNLREYFNKKQGAVSPKRISQMLKRAAKSIGRDTSTFCQLVALKYHG